MARWQVIEKDHHSDSRCVCAAHRAREREPQPQPQPQCDNQPNLANAAGSARRQSGQGADTAYIPGGKGLVGTNSPLLPDDGESPLKRAKVTPLRMGVCAVTNREFAQFIAASGYITDAEQFGWSFVFYGQVKQDMRATLGVAGAQWWRKIEGANWRSVLGDEPWDYARHLDHPVVHVSWNDATAYAKWVGARLPTEAEWEHAARGGLGDVPYPWGDREPNDADTFLCNIWQGDFPRCNTAADGWLSTAPARSFTPNAYGLYNTVGNVWEWTADTYRVKSRKKQVQKRLSAMRGFKVLKGGSFLCHKSYCHRYRIAARTGNSPDSTTSHQGFRVVWDV